MASILDLFPGYAAERDRVQRLSQGGFPAQADDFAQSFVPFYGAGKSGLQGDYGSALAQGAVEAGLTFAPALKKPVGGLLGLVRSAFSRPEAPAPAPRRAPPQPQQRPIQEVAREREMGDYQGSRVNAQAEWQSRYSQAAMDAAQGNMTQDAVFFSQRMPDQFAAQVRRASGGPQIPLQDMPTGGQVPGTIDADSQLIDDILGGSTVRPGIDDVPSQVRGETPTANDVPVADLQNQAPTQNPALGRKQSQNTSGPRAPRITNERKDDVLRALSQNPDAQLTGSELKYQQFLEPQARAFGEGDVGQGYRIMQTVRDSGARKRPFVEAGLAGGIGTAAAVSDEDFLAEMRAYLSEFGQ